MGPAKGREMKELFEGESLLAISILSPTRFAIPDSRCYIDCRRKYSSKADSARFHYSSLSYLATNLVGENPNLGVFLSRNSNPWFAFVILYLVFLVFIQVIIRQDARVDD